jgi:uncharacterized protein
VPVSTFRTAVPASAAELFDWHARPGAFERLNPPWDPVRVVSRTGAGLEVGAELTFEARIGPAKVQWVARHVACDPGGFVDEQVSGPFARWRHEHGFADGVLVDTIDWAVPLGAVGRAFAEGAVEERIARAFAFRHRRTVDDLARIAPYRDRPRLRVAVTGASGMVGADLCAMLDAAGHEVVRVSIRGGVDLDSLRGADAVVHLAGEPIAGRRWSAAHKERVLRSRVDGTDGVCRAIAGLDPKPAVLVSASATGWYGDRGEAVLDEGAPRGDGFLAEVCEAWEAATAPARAAGIRVVNLRIGMVVCARGGALASMLPAFRAGVGGRIGPGTQWVGWISIDDLTAAIHAALWEPVLEGPVNAVSPVPVRQADLAGALGAVLSRPAVVPTPRLAVAAMLGGQAADELLLASQRVVPRALEAAGFTFRYPAIEAALRHQLGR